MGKRSDFERLDKDKYKTWDPRAVVPLITHLPVWTKFFEPCAGDGSLVRQLELAGLRCTGAVDIEPEDPSVAKKDALLLRRSDLKRPDALITNPPWSRDILHSLIKFLPSLGRPVWLLFDTDWAFTQQSEELIPFCSDIIPIGRLKWIPKSKWDAKDNCAWYRFRPDHETGPTRLWPRRTYDPNQLNPYEEFAK